MPASGTPRASIAEEVELPASTHAAFATPLPNHSKSGRSGAFRKVPVGSKRRRNRTKSSHRG
ncbi:hypothetical protein GCM10009528_41490 [Kineococcus aurantiacus]